MKIYHKPSFKILSVNGHCECIRSPKKSILVARNFHQEILFNVLRYSFFKLSPSFVNSCQPVMDRFMNFVYGFGLKKNLQLIIQAMWNIDNQQFEVKYSLTSF